MKKILKIIFIFGFIINNSFSIEENNKVIKEKKIKEFYNKVKPILSIGIFIGSIFCFKKFVDFLNEDQVKIKKNILKKKIKQFEKYNIILEEENQNFNTTYNNLFNYEALIKAKTNNNLLKNYLKGLQCEIEESLNSKSSNYDDIFIKIKEAEDLIKKIILKSKYIIY